MPALIQLAAAALIAGQHFDAPAPVQQSSADQAMARHEICYMLATGVAYPLELRDCLTFAQSPDPGFKTQVCKFLKQTEQLADFEFPSYAACLGELDVR
jgi:hypothetical protein